MGRFDVKSEEKAPSDANKSGKRFGGGNNVWRKDFAGTSKALNALQVKFDCWEGNEGVQFLECIRLMTAYLSTNLEASGNVETSIWNREGIQTTMAGPGRTKPGGLEGHATGRIRD